MTHLSEDWLKRVDEIEEVLKRIDRQRTEVKADTGDEIADSTVECPRCKGRFHYQVQRSNGHVRGSCMSKHCDLAFIQ